MITITPGLIHTLFQIEPRTVRDVNRIAAIAAKLKLPCDACTLQSTRSSCNHSTVNPTCQLCDVAEDTQLELSASNTVKVDYRLPVTCSDFNSTTVNSLGLDLIDLLPVTLSISYRCLNVVSNTDFYAICSHYYHFSNRIVTNIILL